MDERGTVAHAVHSRCLNGHVADQFSTLCTVRADTTKLAKSLSPRRAADGSLYYALEMKVILLFGLTELTAQVSWMENVSFFLSFFLGILDSLLRSYKGAEVR